MESGFEPHSKSHAGIAQLVEQRTENPRVGGSSPPPGIQEKRHLNKVNEVKADY